MTSRNSRRKRPTETHQNGKGSANGFTNAVFNIEPTEAHIILTEGQYAGLEIFASLELSVAAYEQMLILQEDDTRRSELLAFFGDGYLRRWNLHLNGEPVPATGEGMRSLSFVHAFQIVARWLEAVVEIPDPLGEGSPDGEVSAEQLIQGLAISSESLSSYNELG